MVVTEGQYRVGLENTTNLLQDPLWISQVMKGVVEQHDINSASLELTVSRLRAF